jgi:hypothetical protein
MTIAVMHSLDVGFNSGKGNILGSWIEMMERTTDNENKPVKQLFTERTQSFFDSLPKISKKKE